MEGGKEPSMDLFVGLDVGTTGVKSLALDRNGKLVASCSESLNLITLRAGWNEQDPEDWWDAVKKVIGKLVGLTKSMGRIRAISTSGQMHSLVLLDENGDVLRNAILWNDQRTYKECGEITEELGGEGEVIKNVGNPILPGFTLPKIIWVRKNEPDVYRRIHKLMLPKDYINYKLTGRVVTEHSDASGTAMYDPSRFSWNEKVLNAFDLPDKFLPNLIDSNEVVGRIKRGVAKELDLPDDVLVVGGGADNACAALGIGVAEQGDVMISLGTSGTVLAPTKDENPDPKGRLHFFSHVVHGTRYHMGVMLSATFSLDWFKTRFLVEDYEKINEEIDKVPVGSNGIIFLPYLNGERTPHRDPFARGVLFGLSSFNSKWDVVRAIFEGVALGIGDSFDIIRELGIKVKDVRITGGGSRSKVWTKIVADVIGHGIWRTETNEGASYGAAMLAFSGFTGMDLREIAKKWVNPVDEIKHEEKKHDEYRKIQYKFRKIYSDLRETFRE